MGKLRNLIDYLKTREFLAVTALCVTMILVVSLGFGLHGLFSLSADKDSGQKDAEGGNKNPVVNQETTNQTCAVAFKDEEFGKAVAAAIKINYGQLTEQDLKKVTELSITGKSKIKSLEDLVFLPALQKLTVKKCAVNSLQGISAAKDLRWLDLSGNKIKDASELATLTKLESVNLSSNPVEKLPSLEGLKSLEELNLDNTSISDIDFLRNSPVKTLHISYTALGNVDMLQYCADLQCLYMYGYNTMELTALEKLEGFHSIYVSEGFDRSNILFMTDKFMTGDKWTKVYLVLMKRGVLADE